MIRFFLFLISFLRATSLSTHDPSGLSFVNNRWFIYATGNNLQFSSSPDLKSWNTTVVFTSGIPSWIHTAVPGNDGSLWAPDVLYFNGTYHLYYAASTFGSQTSCIGLATTTDLAGNRWTDGGSVVCSGAGKTNYNAIDPHVFFDGVDGSTLWMVLGSFWTGIKIIELNPKTGKPINESVVYDVAKRNPSQSSDDAIEASWIQYHNGYYYLFVNWDYCCRGVSSTYNIRIGRSKTITGPYLDQAGVSMLDGGGTLFLGTSGRYIGPGQTGIYVQGSGQPDLLTFHYYDGNNNGAPTLEIRSLTWNETSHWPIPPPPGF